MENDDMKKCPYCFEMIKKKAIKCRYCGSLLTKKEFKFDFLSTPGYWHRVKEGKKIAGVCTGIARQLDSPILILPLRLFFILTTIFYGFGFILYIIFWLLMSEPTDMPGRGEKSQRGENTRPASEDEKPVSIQDTEEAGSPDEPVKKDMKMIRILRGFILTAVGVFLLFRIYLFALENVIGIAVSPVLLFPGFFFSGILLTVILVIIYLKKHHAPMAKVH